MDIKLKSDIKMSTNPSYSITKQDREKVDQFDYGFQGKISLEDDIQDTIKMDSNPSYGSVQGYDKIKAEYDAVIQQNPSYSSISKDKLKISEDEDEDGYVDCNSQSTQRSGYLKIIGPTNREKESVYDNDADDIDNVKVNLNPSYDSVSGSVKLEDNPSYSKIILGQHP